MKPAAYLPGVLATLVAVLPCAAMAADQPAGANGPVIGGSLVWPGVEWFPAGQVIAARDARFKNVVAAAPLTEDGHFLLPVAPGEYYLMASVDLNADGKPDAPDGLGFYGVEKPKDAPKALSLTPEAEGAIIEIRITLQFAEGGKLHEATVGPDVGMAVLRGEVSHDAAGGKVYVIAWPEADGVFGSAMPAAEDGTFEMKLQAGKYVVFAVSDDDGNGSVDPGEKACVLAEKGRPTTLRLLPGAQVKLPAMALGGKWQGEIAIAQDGAVIELPVSSRPDVVQVKLAEADTAGDAPWCRLLLFADPRLRSLVASAWVHSGSWVAIRPATYFALCGIDLNGDARIGPGDKLAAHADDKGSPLAASFRYGQITDLTFAPAATLADEFFRPRDQGTPQ